MPQQMEISLLVLQGVCGLVWIYAVIHAVRAARNRAEDVPLSRLLFNGRLFFDGDAFTETGRIYQRRFVVAALLFLALVIGTIVFGLTTLSNG